MPIKKATFRSRPRARASTRRKVKMGGRRRPMVGKLARRKTDYARVVEAFQTPINTDATGVYSNIHTYSLADYQRAQEVAHAYKYYRCAKIELVFVPYATQSLTNGAPAGKMPQLYFTLDRVGNMWQFPSEAELNERGLTPKLFRNKYKFTFKPNLLQHIQMETNQPADGGGNPLGINVINAVNSVPVWNKWLPTQQSAGFKPGLAVPNQVGQQVTQAAGNPYALKYYGAISLVTIDNPTAVVVGELFQKITWEFKSPRALKADGAHGAEPYSHADQSIMNPAVVPNTQPTNYP